MDSLLLRKDVQDFINTSLQGNFSKIALTKNPFPDIKWNDILNQIASKSKAKDKLPTWFSHQCIIYPSKISIEQTSSEIAAKYKASIISGVTLIDLTGGFGIDDYYFAQQFNKVAHCELNAELSEIVNHNYHILNQRNIECYQGDSLEILKELNQQWSWIYVDPSRRSDVKGKVFMLKDCLPNVPNLLETYFNYSNNILIKTAPILDITSGLSELSFVKKIHIVAIENEVKELLWEIENNYDGDVEINAVSITKEKIAVYSVNLSEIQTETNAEYSEPMQYLYEPNAAMMKTGAFDDIATHFNLKKLQQHSHLYTSETEIEFPGRKFAVKKIFHFDKTEMKKNLEGKKCNITVRNFPISVEEIRKKWKIKDGGNLYCFFTTNLNNEKIVVLCEKI
ncbi:THUMP-like domain-containing protein [Flavobacterium sp.]|uniref:THUMP-like domain-containing protein n=1 Tax=Flavobacterium sp. TaxID=239 RepID=UPI0028BF1A18|nr:class I SAM-dependent methyltransferase [Flavobacterium sp.]